MASEEKPEHTATTPSPRRYAPPVERCIWAFLILSLVAAIGAIVTLPFGIGWHHPSAWLIVVAAGSFMVMAFMDQPRRTRMSQRYQYLSFIAFGWIIVVAAIQLIVACIHQ